MKHQQIIFGMSAHFLVYSGGKNVVNNIDGINISFGLRLCIHGRMVLFNTLTEYSSSTY